MQPEEITRLIETAMPGAQVRVLSDDNTHFEALVIAPQFEDKRALARHQLVYAALGDRVGGEIHALSIKAYTPEEWAAKKASASKRFRIFPSSVAAIRVSSRILN